MTTALTNVLNERIRPERAGRCVDPCAMRLRRWLNKWLPRVASHRNSMADLADGYDEVARRCIARGDLAGAALYGGCARALRKRLGER